MAQNTDIQAYQSLGADVNKVKGALGDETKQGVVSQKLPELTLDMPDDDIVKLADKWEKDWNDSSAKQEWEKQCDESEKYWLGKQFEGPKTDKTRAQIDNLIFESLETYLPQVTRRNPEPLVTLDETEDPDPKYDAFIEKVKRRLSGLADKNKLRLKLKKTARHWAIFLIGIVKFGWDLDKDMPILRVIRPKRVILDPEATIDEDGYNGERIGEYRKLSASRILAIIGDTPETANAIKEIKTLVKEDNLATMINFIEWWTPEYMCWKLNKVILLKKKNPHWNYDSTIQPPTDPSQALASETTQVDNYGNTTSAPVEKKGNNHFATPQMPYEFLSVFNLGDQPMDKTSLILQNLSNQDLINKRNKQIDKNADRMNGGMVVSLERSGLTQSQAKGVTEALRKGGVVVIPSGSPREAIDDYAPSALPADVYNQLQDTRIRLRDIFGTAGSTTSGVRDEKTVRGKIMIKGLDTDRIGGGVSEYLEQLSDNIYNWLLQLLYVYDPAFQFIEGGVPPKLSVSVKEGSLLPKDSISIANQALELAGMNRISNLDLYKRLEYPNPEELAANVWLELNAPELLYKENPLIAQAIQMRQQSSATGAKPPSESISFKDLTPSGKTQMAAQAGIHLDPAEVAMKDAQNNKPAVPTDAGSNVSNIPIPSG